MIKKRNALIIENNDLLCNILTAEIRSFCDEVECCISASHAADMISKKRFDVFIVDYRLPGMNGVDITALLRLTYPDSYIIGMSAELKEDAFLTAGADAFLLKPFGIDALISHVA